METATLTLGEITVTTTIDRPVVKEAKKNLCMSPAFWIKIKAEKFPYVIDLVDKKFKEATYSTTMNFLQEKRGRKIFWITDQQIDKMNMDLCYVLDLEELYTEAKAKLEQKIHQ